jgi:hypothetical protein
MPVCIMFFVGNFMSMSELISYVAMVSYPPVEIGAYRFRVVIKK